MIIIPQKIKIHWTTKNKLHYIGKGYSFTQLYNEVEVDIFDLQPNSNLQVKCKCDFCGQECNKRFSTVSQYLNEIKYKIACNDCIRLKIKETNLEKYGTEHPLQNEIIQMKIKKTNLERYGVEYTGQAKTKKDKTKQTNLEKYGVEYNLQRKNIREQIKQTNLKKYGAEHPLQNNDILNKVKQTNLERYGNVCAMNGELIQQQIKQTNLEKYGVEYNLQSEENKLKTKKTNLKKYGVEFPLQNKDILNKVKQTNLKKYGVEYGIQNKTIKQKQIDSLYKNGTAPCSKQQRHLHQILGGELNYPVDNCLLDIAFPDEKIYIEYNGGGHDLQVKLGNISAQEFNQREIKRKNYMQKKGWKIIRIISTKDKLPLDKELIVLIENAKQYLLNTVHTWYDINLDKFLIENSLGKIILNG